MVKWCHKDKDIARLMNEFQSLADKAGLRARDLLQGEDARMKAKAAEDAYTYCISRMWREL